MFLEEFEPGLPTKNVVATFGKAAELRGGTGVHAIYPRPLAECPPNTYSGIYGLGEFPAHTDFAHWYTPPETTLEDDNNEPF